jgi:hypothetical protein
MKVRYGKDIANHSGPESSSGAREGAAYALTGDTGQPGIEPRNQKSGMRTLLREAEGNILQGVYRKSYDDPAQSEILRTPGSFLHRNWEVSSVPAPSGTGGAGKSKSRNPAIDADEKSDPAMLWEKPPNNRVNSTEAAEGRGVAKENTDKTSAPRTQSRTSCASMGLEGLRDAARRDQRMRFTALRRHFTPDLLTESIYALRRKSATGVDGVTWQEYENVLLERLSVLHREIHAGAYMAQLSRRV